MVDPTFAHIAEAMQPQETASRAAVLTALGAVFGFAAAWPVLHYLDGWYGFAALFASAGALVGAIIARLTREA